MTCAEPLVHRLRRAAQPSSPAARRASGWPPRPARSPTRGGAQVACSTSTRAPAGAAASASGRRDATTPRSARRCATRPSGWAASTSLVNNAGIGAQGTVEDNDDDEWRRVLDVNVSASCGSAVRALAAPAPVRRTPRSSTRARSRRTAGLPNRALYSATKGARAVADARDGRRPRERGHPRQLREPGNGRHAVGRPAARAGRRPRRRAGGARGPPADGPPRQRRGGRRGDLLPGVSPLARRRPPAPCSPSTAACTACASVHRPDAAPGRRQRARRRSRAGAPTVLGAMLASGPTPATIDSTVGRSPGARSSSAARIAARCSGVVPQHPPTIAGAGVGGEHGVAGHQLGRARVVRPRCPGTAGRRSSPSTRRGSRRRLRHRQHRHEDVGRTDAAVGADGDRATRRGRRTRPGSRPAPAPSSCARRCRTSTSRRTGRPTAIAARAAARTSSGADIVSIHATSAPPSRRAAICSPNAATAASSVERAERLEELAGRPDRAGDHHRPARRRGDLAGDRRRRPAPARRRGASAPCSVRRWRLQPNVLVRMMSAPASTKRRCSDADLVRCVDVPELGRLAGPEAHLEVVGARCAVGEQHPPGGEQRLECRSHAGTLPIAPRS